MSEGFKTRAVELLKSMGLGDAIHEDDLYSLRFDHCVVSITEKPVGHLLAFSRFTLPQVEPLEAQLTSNIFSDECLDPIFARLDNDRNYMLWNRQPLQDCSVATMQKQIELIVDLIEFMLKKN